MAKLSTLLKTITGISILAAAVLAPAQAAQVPDGVKLAQVQEFRFNLGGDPNSLDPLHATDVTSLEALRPVYEALVFLDGNGVYHPRGAESWETSADGLTWTFHLRKNAKWQDGQPVVAQQYVDAWKRVIDPNNASYNGTLFADVFVKNVYEANQGKVPLDQVGFKVVDDYTIQVQLDQPAPWLLTAFTAVFSAPVRLDLIEKYGKDWVKPGNIVGNGPFKITNYHRGDYIDYELSDTYWGKSDFTLTKLHGRFIGDYQTALAAYLAGDVFTVGVRQNLLEKFKKERPDEFYSYDTPVTRFLGLNVKTVPDYVRKALLLVIDGKFIAEKVTHSSTYSSLWVPKHAHEHELAQEAPFTKETIEQRRAEAVKLLTDNGVTPEKPVKLRFLQATGTYVLYNAVAALVKEGTKGAIQFELDAVEPKIFFDKWKAKDFDVRASGQSTNSGHAIEFYSQLTCKSSYNSLNYCNPEFDKLVASASHLSEEKDRAKVWAQLATIVQNDAPVVPFGEGLYNRLVSPALGGFKPTFYPDLRDYYVIADKKPKSE